MKRVLSGRRQIPEKRVLRCVYSAIDAHNRGAASKHRLEKSTSAVLFGKDGRLDSLGLVNMIVAVEESVSKEFGAELILADSRAMSQKTSPFRTVRSLVDYVSLLLKESGAR